MMSGVRKDNDTMELTVADRGGDDRRDRMDKISLCGKTRERVNAKLHAQSRSRLTFSMDFAFPFSRSRIRLIDSPISFKSSAAFLAFSRDLCFSNSSSCCSNSSSSVGGTVSGGCLRRAERTGTGDGYEESLDDISVNESGNGPTPPDLPSGRYVRRLRRAEWWIRGRRRRSRRGQRNSGEFTVQRCVVWPNFPTLSTPHRTWAVLNGRLLIR
jgi:hypothetical protein